MSKVNKVYYFVADLDVIAPINLPEWDGEPLYGYLTPPLYDKIEVIDQEYIDAGILTGMIVTEKELHLSFEEQSAADEFLTSPTASFESATISFGEFEKVPEKNAKDANTIKVPKAYNPHLSNTTRTSDKLASMLEVALAKDERPDCISLLFHGVPGTGKTLAAAHLAKQLGITMKSYNISELQGKYVGESEKLITAAFKDAAKEGHILHLDEIDSLSGSREQSDQDFSIKVVNCVLQNMDTYKGIFVATTNLLTNMDTAILRRFLLKQEFNNVTSDQAVKLAKIYFKGKAPRDLPADVFAPSDFNIVKSSLLFEEDTNVTRAFIKERLIEEATLRNGSDLSVPKRSLGFI